MRLRRFLEIGQSETKIAYMVAICLLTERDEMSNLYRGPFIDASYKMYFGPRFYTPIKLQKKCIQFLNIDIFVH